MKKENSVLHQTAKKAVQTMIGAQTYGWPPECLTAILYQPKRPEKPVDAKAEEPSK